MEATNVNTNTNNKMMQLVQFKLKKCVFPSNEKLVCYFSIPPTAAAATNTVEQNDWIGIFKVGWQSLKEVQVKKPIAELLNNVVEVESQPLNYVVFDSLPACDETEMAEQQFYQFIYVKGGCEETGIVRGVSEPFSIQRVEPEEDDDVEILATSPVPFEHVEIGMEKLAQAINKDKFVVVENEEEKKLEEALVSAAMESKKSSNLMRFFSLWGAKEEPIVEEKKAVEEQVKVEEEEVAVEKKPDIVELERELRDKHLSEHVEPARVDLEHLLQRVERVEYELWEKRTRRGSVERLREMLEREQCVDEEEELKSLWHELLVCKTTYKWLPAVQHVAHQWQREHEEHVERMYQEQQGVREAAELVKMQEREMRECEHGMRMRKLNALLGEIEECAEMIRCL